MSYQGIAQIAKDQFIRERVVACLTIENTINNDHPESVADTIMWKLAVTDTWADVYEEAMVEEGRTVPPGIDESVISDAMIRNAVRSALGLE